MKRCKITVLKTTLDKELVAELLANGNFVDNEVYSLLKDEL